MPDWAGLQKKLLILVFLLVQPGGWLKTMSELVLAVSDSANLFKKSMLCMTVHLLLWKVQVAEKKSSLLLKKILKTKKQVCLPQHLISLVLWDHMVKFSSFGGFFIRTSFCMWYNFLFFLLGCHGRHDGS